MEELKTTLVALTVRVWTQDKKCPLFERSLQYWRGQPSKHENPARAPCRRWNLGQCRVVKLNSGLKMKGNFLGVSQNLPFRFLPTCGDPTTDP